MARCNKLTLLTKERRVVNHKQHRHGGLVDSDRSQWLWILQVADAIANLKLIQSDYSADVATLYLLGMYMSHTLKGVQLLNLSLLHGAIAVCNGNLHAILQGATVYTTYGDTTLIARIVE